MSKVQFEQLISRSCALDVHQKTVVATINGEDLNVQPESLEGLRVRERLDCECQAC